jgi:hypothetical protein
VGVSFGQSKKKQIEALNKRIDSLVEANVLKTRIIDEKLAKISELKNDLTRAYVRVSDLQGEVNKRLSEMNSQNAEIVKLKYDLAIKSDSIKQLSYDKPYLHPIDSLRWGYDENEEVWLRPVDQVLNYLGVYQSEDACTLEMPRFTDKVGPTMSVSISAFNDYRNSTEGEIKDNYYLVINFCGVYSGQYEENNENWISTEILDFHQEGEVVKMTLQASSCAEYYSMNQEEKQEQKMLNNTFTLSMKFLANGKVMMSTENAPELCHHDWGFENVTFYPLVWSR